MKKYIIILLCGLSLSFAQDYLGDEDDARFVVYGGFERVNSGDFCLAGCASLDPIMKFTLGGSYLIDEKQEVGVMLSARGGDDPDYGEILLSGANAFYNYTFFDNLTIAMYAGGVYGLLNTLEVGGEEYDLEDNGYKEENDYGVQFGMKWFASEAITVQPNLYISLLDEQAGGFFEGRTTNLSILVGYSF